MGKLTFKLKLLIFFYIIPWLCKGSNLIGLSLEAAGISEVHGIRVTEYKDRIISSVYPGSRALSLDPFLRRMDLYVFICNTAIRVQNLESDD